jgi:two-component system nitrate/nitrite response regulator NarL
MSRARVLLADDNAEILETVSQLLAPHFDVVGAVTNGELLLQTFRALRPDVLVLDISMPVRNGIEAVAHLKAEGFEAKVVFLTIHDDVDFVTACFAVGAKGYVLKARLLSDLVQAIDAALANRTFLSLSQLRSVSSYGRKYPE